MVAHHWLQRAVADENWRLRQQPQPPQNVDNQEEHTVAKESEFSSEHSDNCSQLDMSVSDMEEPAMCSPVNLPDCGPSVEQNIAHVANGLDHHGALSTGKQCERKWEEHKEFAKVVSKNEAITLDGCIKFEQFQVHCKMQVTKDKEATQETEAETLGNQRKHKTKRTKNWQNKHIQACVQN